MQVNNHMDLIKFKKLQNAIGKFVIVKASKYTGNYLFLKEAASKESKYNAFLSEALTFNTYSEAVMYVVNHVKGRARVAKVLDNLELEVK